MLDAHFHLDFFERSEHQILVEKAIAHGVYGGVVAGVWLEHASSMAHWASNVKNSSTKLSPIAFAEKSNRAFPDKHKFTLFASAGLHPWYQRDHWIKPDGTTNVGAMDAHFAEFERIVCNHQELFWAIGETGFDLHRVSGSEKERLANMQRVAFEYCIDVANKHSLPIVVHTRNAWNATQEILLSPKRKTAALLHCYGGSSESLQQLRNCNVYASFGGPITWQNSRKLRQVVQYCPEEMLLFETDAPDLPPLVAGEIPKRNEPWMLFEVVKMAARVRCESPEALANRSDINLARWLGLAK